jgi:hypothetical protein
MNPDPIVPARGCAWGLVLGSLCWAVILVVLILMVLP